MTAELHAVLIYNLFYCFNKSSKLHHIPGVSFYLVFLLSYSLIIQNLGIYYPRDAMLARVIEIALSVRLSVMRRYCVKTKKASGMISSPSDSPKTLVSDAKFHHQILRGSPRTGCSNMGRSEKFSDFLALSVYISKTVADTAKVTISD